MWDVSKFLMLQRKHIKEGRKERSKETVKKKGWRIILQYLHVTKEVSKFYSFSSFQDINHEMLYVRKKHQDIKRKKSWNKTETK